MRNKHLSERVDLRSYALRLKKGAWLPLLCLLCGAVAGLLIYFLATTVFGPGRMYRAESKLYINFSPEMAQDAYPYYNDYTWRTLVTTDEILDGILAGMEERQFTIAEESDPMDMGSRVISASEIKETIYATLPSDIRLMVITFTNHDPIICNAVMEATDASLVTFGNNHKEFESIEIRAEDVAQIVTYTDRTVVAMIAGGVIGLLIGLFLLSAKELLQDAVFTPKEAQERYGLPVRGVLLKNENAAGETAALLRNDLRDAVCALKNDGTQTLGVVAAQDVTGIAQAERVTNCLDALLADCDVPGILPKKTPGTDEDALAALNGCDAVLLIVRAGKDEATLTERCIAALKNAGIPVAGMLLTDAEEAFMRAYYRLK